MKHYHIISTLKAFYTLLILRFIYIYVHYYVFMYYQPLGVLYI